MQELYEKLSRLITEQSRAFNALERRFRASLPVTLQQSRIIEAVAKYGELTLNGLSAYLGISISTMSRNVEKLVVKNILNKLPDPKDARISTLTLTKKGDTLAAQIDERRAEYFRQIFSYLPEDKISEYVDSGKKMLSAIEKTYLRSNSPRKSGP